MLLNAELFGIIIVEHNRAGYQALEHTTIGMKKSIIIICMSLHLKAVGHSLHKNSSTGWSTS